MKKIGATILVLLALIVVPAFVSAFSDIGAAAAAVVVEANKTIVNATPASTPAPLNVNESGYIKLPLGRGQNLWRIALERTGDAKNWCAIAKASGKSCEEAAMRNLFVGMVITIPQSLLKKELLPSPSAELYNIAINTIDRLMEDKADLQENLADAQRELWYWRAVFIFLFIVGLYTTYSGIKGIKLYKRKYNALEAEVERCKKLTSGNPMDFQTHQYGIVKAVILEVGVMDVDIVSDEGVTHVYKPVVTKVECPICKMGIVPNKLLHHYFEHPDPLSGTLH